MPIRFQQYLPQSAQLLLPQIGDQCDVHIHKYQKGLQQSGESVTKDLCRDALNCILDTLDPTTSYNLQSANVLLGLTPTMLSLLGNASAEISLLSFSGRPLLAFMLNMGAPVLAVAGTFKFQHPLEVLKTSTSERGSPFPTPRGVTSVVIPIVEYLLAAAAAINVALLAYDISIKAVYVVNCGRTWYAFLWMYLCLALHPLGLLSFWSQVSIRRSSTVSSPLKEKSGWISSEIRHCASFSGISYSLKGESWISLGLEWLVSHGAIVQIIFGTLVLSSSTLISAHDAFAVIGRFAASAILCRLILMYELYGLRAAVAAGTVQLN